MAMFSEWVVFFPWKLKEDLFFCISSNIAGKTSSLETYLVLVLVLFHRGIMSEQSGYNVQ